MKFRQFALALALILEILAMHVLTLAIPRSSSSPINVAASAKEASTYSPRKTTILDDIAISGANLDKRQPYTDTDLDSFLNIINNENASLFGYGHYLDRQQTNGLSVGLDYSDESILTNTFRMPLLTVGVYNESGYLIVHSYTWSINDEPEENGPSGILEADLAIAALSLRHLFGTDDNNTQVNSSPSATAFSLLSIPELAPLLVKRNSIDGAWGGKSCIIAALFGGGFVLFMLASCCYHYSREENARKDMEYNYNRHEEINQRAYTHQQREFGRLGRAEELSQPHHRELERLRWHRDACAGPDHTHDDAANPPSADELAYARRQRSQPCHACHATRVTKTTSADNVDLRGPPQIYGLLTPTHHDDLPDQRITGSK